MIDIDFNNPNEKIKKFAEKEGLDLKDPTIQESINGIKKKYINEINEFHQSNLMLMQQTNENNKKEDPMNGKNPRITKSSYYICV